MRCEELRELAPDIALGIADGEKRSEALEHMAGCSECRRVVEQLSEVCDELLMMAPLREPPAGFETRVLGRLNLRRPATRRRFGWALRRLGPPIAAAAVTVAAFLSIFGNDIQVAGRYRAALDTANGRYFQADHLLDPAGRSVGVAFAYQGSPSWILLTVDPAHRGSVMTAQLIATSGRRVALKGFSLNPNDGTWGGAIPLSLDNLASVRLLGKHPGDVLRATIHANGAGDAGD